MLTEYDAEYADFCCNNVQNKDPEYEKIKNDLCKRSDRFTGRTSEHYKAIVANEINPINGYIDYAFSQGLVNDCWLLGPVAALAEKIMVRR